MNVATEPKQALRSHLAVERAWLDDEAIERIMAEGWGPDIDGGTDF